MKLYEGQTINFSVERTLTQIMKRVVTFDKEMESLQDTGVVETFFDETADKDLQNGQPKRLPTEVVIMSGLTDFREALMAGFWCNFLKIHGISAQLSRDANMRVFPKDDLVIVKELPEWYKTLSQELSNESQGQASLEDMLNDSGVGLSQQN